MVTQPAEIPLFLGTNLKIASARFRLGHLAVPRLGMADLWTLTWVAGPDAGGTVVLGNGAHIVGRAQGAAVRCDDPALEPHHLLIEITAEGASLRQLTGRLPVRARRTSHLRIESRSRRRLEWNSVTASSSSARVISQQLVRPQILPTSR